MTTFEDIVDPTELSLQPMGSTVPTQTELLKQIIDAGVALETSGALGSTGPSGATGVAGATGVGGSSAVISLVADNVVSGARTSSSSATLTATFTAATAVKHHVLLSVCSSGDTVLSSVTDSRGNIWQVDVTKNGQATAASVASCHITIAHHIGDTLTLTFSASNSDASAIGSEWSNLASTSWLDKTASSNGSSGVGTSGTTSTRSQAKELLFGSIAYNNATTKTAAAGFTSLTTQNSGAGNRKTSPIYELVTVVGTDAASWADVSTAYDAVIATYKAGDGSGVYLEGTGAWTDPSVVLGLGTAAYADSSDFASGDVLALAQAYTDEQIADGDEITDLTAIASGFVVGDLLFYYDSTNSVLKKITLANALQAVGVALHAATALTAANTAVDDEWPTWDTSATTLKRQTVAEAALTVMAQSQAINAQTGTTYTLAATDPGKLITCSNASAITLTVPQDSAVTFAVGAWCEVYNLGAGQVTVAAGSGATLRATPGAKLRAQYSRAFLQKIDANTWALAGDISA